MAKKVVRKKLVFDLSKIEKMAEEVQAANIEDVEMNNDKKSLAVIIKEPTTAEQVKNTVCIMIEQAALDSIMKKIDEENSKIKDERKRRNGLNITESELHFAVRKIFRDGIVRTDKKKSEVIADPDIWELLEPHFVGDGERDWRPTNLAMACVFYLRDVFESAENQIEKADG